MSLSFSITYYYVKHSVCISQCEGYRLTSRPFLAPVYIIKDDKMTEWVPFCNVFIKITYHFYNNNALGMTIRDGVSIKKTGGLRVKNRRVSKCEPPGYGVQTACLATTKPRHIVPRQYLCRYIIIGIGLSDGYFVLADGYAHAGQLAQLVQHVGHCVLALRHEMQAHGHVAVILKYHCLVIPPCQVKHNVE